jgi:hypothetical protein
VRYFIPEAKNITHSKISGKRCRFSFEILGHAFQQRSMASKQIKAIELIERYFEPKSAVNDI